MSSWDNSFVLWKTELHTVIAGVVNKGLMPGDVGYGLPDVALIHCQYRIPIQWICHTAILLQPAHYRRNGDAKYEFDGNGFTG